MKKIIGFLKELKGEIFALDGEGNLRELKEGDELHEGEIVVNSEGQEIPNAIKETKEDNSDRSGAEVDIEAGSILGNFKNLDGEHFAKNSSSGKTRKIMAGDTIYDGEVVVNDSGEIVSDSLEVSNSQEIEDSETEEEAEAVMPEGTIGYLKDLQGIFFAQDKSSGTLRAINPGDPVMEGEMVVNTSQNEVEDPLFVPTKDTVNNSQAESNVEAPLRDANFHRIGDVPTTSFEDTSSSNGGTGIGRKVFIDDSSTSFISSNINIQNSNPSAPIYDSVIENEIPIPTPTPTVTTNITRDNIPPTSEIPDKPIGEIPENPPINNTPPIGIVPPLDINNNPPTEGIPPNSTERTPPISLVPPINGNPPPSTVDIPDEPNSDITTPPPTINIPDEPNSDITTPPSTVDIPNEPNNSNNTPPPSGVVIKLIALNENGEPIVENGNYVTTNDTPEGSVAKYKVLAFAPNTTIFKEDSELADQLGKVNLSFSNGDSATLPNAIGAEAPADGETSKTDGTEDFINTQQTVSLGAIVSTDTIDDYRSDDNEQFKVAIIADSYAGNGTDDADRYENIDIKTEPVITTILDNSDSTPENTSDNATDNPEATTDTVVIKLIALDKDGTPITDTDGIYQTANSVIEGSSHIVNSVSTAITANYKVLAFAPNTTEFKESNLVSEQLGQVDILFTDGIVTDEIASGASGSTPKIDGTEDYVNTTQTSIKVGEVFSTTIINDLVADNGEKFNVNIVANSYAESTDGNKYENVSINNDGVTTTIVDFDQATINLDEHGLRDKNNPVIAETINNGAFPQGAETMELIAPTDTFTSHGNDINWDTSTDGTLIGYTGTKGETSYKEVLKTVIDKSDGKYTTTLLDIIDQSNPDTPADENKLSTQGSIIPIGVKSTTDGVVIETTLNIDIKDDTPEALAGDNVLTLYVESVTTNLSFVIDISSSMTNYDLETTEEAIRDAVNAYKEFGDVNINIVQFYGNGKHESGWINNLDDISTEHWQGDQSGDTGDRVVKADGTVSRAGDLHNSESWNNFTIPRFLDNTKRGTDIEEGLKALVDNSYNDNQPIADNDIVYFLGDGDTYNEYSAEDTIAWEYQTPFDKYTGITTRTNNIGSTNDNDTPNNASDDWTIRYESGDIDTRDIDNPWSNFITGGSIDKLYTYSVNTSGVLTDIALVSNNNNTLISPPATAVTVSELNNDILSKVEISKDGSFAENSDGETLIEFGADGGHLDSVTIVDGKTVNYDKDNPEQLVEGENGNFLVDFNTGRYTYTVTATDRTNHVEKIDAVIIDNDGDKVDTLLLDVNIIYSKALLSEVPQIVEVDNSVVSKVEQIIGYINDDKEGTTSTVSASNGTASVDNYGNIRYTSNDGTETDKITVISTDSDGHTSSRNIAIDVLSSDDNADAPILSMRLSDKVRLFELNNFNIEDIKDDGWTLTDATGENIEESEADILRIANDTESGHNKDITANKTFDFGKIFANKEVEVSFITNVKNNAWDDNGDYMKLTLGDDPLIEVSKRYKLEDKTHTYSTTLDDDGKIVINILNYSDSKSGAEWLDIDDFQIKSNNYKYNLTLNAKKTDDSETLSEIEIKDLPHGAYLLNGDTKLTATDGVYTINNTTTALTLVTLGELSDRASSAILASVTSSTTEDSVTTSSNIMEDLKIIESDASIITGTASQIIGKVSYDGSIISDNLPSDVTIDSDRNIVYSGTVGGDLNLSFTDDSGKITTQTINVKMVSTNDNADAPTLTMSINEPLIINKIDDFIDMTDNGWSGNSTDDTDDEDSVLNIDSLENSDIASKTFDFTTNLANRTVEVSFFTEIKSNWNSSTDTLNITANNVDVYTEKSNSTLDNYKIEHSFKTTLDTNGKLALSIENDSTDDSTYLKLDNMHIKTTDYQYKINLTSALANSSDNETLSNITLKDIPEGAILQNSSGTEIAVNSDGVYDVGNGDMVVTLISKEEITSNHLDNITASVSATEANGDISTVERQAGEDAIVVDGIIEGLYYETTSGFKGYTDSNGEFDYYDGDKVIFKIGDLVVGSMDMENSNDDKVFLQDLAQVDRTNMNDEYVENMAVLLQSIDNSDGDNIVITQEMRDSFIDNDIDLVNISEEDLAKAIEDIGRTAVSEEDAMEHVGDMLEEYDGVEDGTLEERVEDEEEVEEEEETSEVTALASPKVVEVVDITEEENLNFDNLYDEPIENNDMKEDEELSIDDVIKTDEDDDEIMIIEEEENEEIIEKEEEPVEIHDDYASADSSVGITVDENTHLTVI